MLEHPSLLLLSWAGSRDSGSGGPGGGAGGSRAILDPDNGPALGFACRRIPPGPSWLRWLARPALEIHEAEDESLLFTLYRPWFHLRAWEVFDAEEHLVGGMRKNRVLDRFGRVLALVSPYPDGSGQKFLAPDGLELGTLLPAGEGSRLDFGPDIAGNPFAKMLVLAASLALTGGSPKKR